MGRGKGDSLNKSVNLLNCKCNCSMHKIEKSNVYEDWLKLNAPPSTDKSIMKTETDYAKAIADNECQLLFLMGKEIDVLLQDLHSKEKHILNQRELIKYLSKNVKFFYKKMKECRPIASKSLCALEAMSKCTSAKHQREYKKFLKRLCYCAMNKPPISKNITNRSVESEEDCAELRQKFKEFEDENRTLKDTIYQANRELEKFYEQANNYMVERDEYKKKHRESVEIIDKITTQRNAETEKYTKMEKDNKEAIEKLKIDNKKKNVEIESARRMSESMTQAQNETIEALQDALREKDLASREIQKITLTASDPSWRSSDSDIVKAGSVHIIAEAIDDLCPSIKDSCPSACVQEIEKLRAEMEAERDMHNQEVSNLKETIDELDKASKSSGDDVNLYQNTIKILEASQEKANTEIQQQRVTISNLQEALVEAKKLLNELQQKTSSEMEELIVSVIDLKNDLTSFENLYLNYCLQIEKLRKIIAALQETNLNLEVKNFECIQDLAMLETRLLKYQCIFKCDQSLQSENIQLKEKIVSLECECNAMKRIVNDAKGLHESFILMQASNDELQTQADIARQELLRESKINEIDGARIEEFQKMLNEKSRELERCQEMLRDAQKKLCWSVCQNNELKTEITDLFQHIDDFQQNYSRNEERTDYCQQEIDLCKCNLTDLKDKLLMMKGLLQQKMDDYGRLENEYRAQNCSLSCLKQKVGDYKMRYEQDVCQLQCTIEDLRDKLAKSENACRCLQENYNKSQAQSTDLSRQEGQLKKDLSDKLQVSQNQILCLNNYVAQLQSECCCLKKDLKFKDQQLNLVKTQIGKLKATEVSHINGPQDYAAVEEKLNRLLQQNQQLQVENESLCRQICELQNNSVAYEQHHTVAGRQLQQCLGEMNGLQIERDQLAAKNVAMQKELQAVHCAYNNLNHSYQELLKSVVSLETDLIESKLNRDEICVESRNVVNNVRNWLEDQTFINEQIQQKIRDDNNTIERLTQKVAIMDNMKCKCCKGRQRGGSNPSTSQQAITWSITSLGSCAESPSKSSMSNPDWYYYENEDDSLDDGDSSANWVKKVEVITEELQKTNEYWQSKMCDDYAVTRDE